MVPGEWMQSVIRIHAQGTRVAIFLIRLRTMPFCLVEATRLPDAFV